MTAPPLVHTLGPMHVPNPEPEKSPAAPVVDAAESSWDPILWTLYLQALSGDHGRTVH